MGTVETKTPSSKETLIVNQYQYTIPLMEEVQDGFAKQTYTNIAVLGLIGAICGFFTYREFITDKGILAVLFGLLFVASVIVCAITLTNTAKKKSAAIQAFKTQYGSNGFEYKISIEGNRLFSYKDGAESVNIRKSDVMGIYETERFFVFQLRGEQLLPLKKGAFLKGNLEQCQNYIPEFKKRK